MTTNNTYAVKAETLVAQWETANKPLGVKSRLIVLEAIKTTIAAFDQTEHQAFWSAYTDKVDAVSRLNAHDCVDCLKAYDSIIGEWNRQNSTSPIDLQASLVWHRAQGLLPSPV